MSAGVVIAVAMVVAAVVMLTASAPALARVGREQPWAERLYGRSPGIQALSVAGTLLGSSAVVPLWSEFGVVAPVVVVAAMVVVARISRWRARRG